MRTRKIKRLRRKITKSAKIIYDGRKYNLRITIKIVRNLKIEKGDLFEFITDRKKEIQKFRIVKKEE